MTTATNLRGWRTEKDFMIKTCVICGEEFESGQSRAKYCGVVCRMDANRIRARWNNKLKKHKLICAVCGKEFETMANNRKYCDDCVKLGKKKAVKPKADKPKQKVTQPEGTVNCTSAIAKTCQYSTKCGASHICSYIEIMGQSRKCPPSACDKYKPIRDKEAHKTARQKEILTKAIGL